MSSYGPFADAQDLRRLGREPRDARRPLLLRDRRSSGDGRRHLDADGHPHRPRARSRSGTSSIRRPCSARRSAPRCNTCSHATRSRRWAIAATNGNAMRSTRRRGGRRCVMAFVFEGMLRQHMIAKGRNRDTAYFSMLDSEWPARKAAFERWLAPDNFDAQGRQKISLSRAERRSPRDRWIANRTSSPSRTASIALARACSRPASR